MHSGSAAPLLFLVLMWVVVYLLPTIIAYSRAHHQRAAICLTNLFLGWSGLGWIVALIWSATAVQQTVVQQAVVASPVGQLPVAQPARSPVVLTIVLILIFGTFALVWAVGT
jgi:hypothetical protein